MFDNICKFLAQNFSEDYAQWLLGKSVTLTELKPTELSLEPIRADSLILLQSDQEILHIEFQTDPDEEIPFRTLDYRVRGYRKFPSKRMRQVVIYLRKTGSPLVHQTRFRMENTSHRFEVIRLWEQPSELFLQSLGLLPLAVLSKTDDPTIILNQVARIVEGISEKQLQNNISAATNIIAGLILEQTVISRLLRSDIMKESVVYQEILREGEAKGEAKGKIEGKIEGIAIGEARGKLTVANNLLNAGYSIEQVIQLTGIDADLFRKSTSN